MSKLPIANQINDNILFEELSVIKGHPHNTVNLVRLVSIDMEDRCSNGFGYFCAIESCPGIHWSSGEPYLVIADDVYHPTWRVALQVLELERLID